MRGLALAVLGGCGYLPGAAGPDAPVGPTDAPLIDAARPDAAGPDAPAPPTPITFRQVNSGVGTNLGSVTVAFADAQLAGDLAVVFVGWYKPGSVSSVVDASGNVYTRAIGPVTSGTESQAIYYACNIAGAAAGANAVTVTFAAGSQDPDVRVVEYTGIATTACLDVARSGTGATTAIDSGPLTTTHLHDLVVAGDFVTNLTSASDPMFVSRLVTTFGDLVEDREVTANASYRATAIENTAGAWVMQVAAFKAAN